MWIAGLLLLAASAGLAYGSWRQRNKLHTMQATETSRARDVAKLAQEVAAEVGAGAFRQRVEVKGRIVCDAPLKSELAGVECVHYAMRVRQEYEETYWESDLKGNRVPKTRRGTETVSENRRSVPFFVEDESGRIEVDPDGAKLVTERVHARFEPAPPSKNALRLGGVAVSFGGIPTSGRRVLGHAYEEDAIPIGREIYVLGEASDRSGRLRIEAPEKGGVFLVSLQGEEQLVKGARTAKLAFAAGSIACALLGVALLVAGLAR